MDTGWYYDRNGVEQGPFLQADIQVALQQGRLNRGTVVWRAGKTNMRSAAFVAGPLGAAQQKVDEPHLEVLPSANIREFVVEGKRTDKTVDGKSSRISNTVVPKEAATFHVRCGINIIGPLSSSVLASMAGAGKIGPTDLVQRSDDAHWRAASEIPELVATGFSAEGSVAEGLEAAGSVAAGSLSASPIQPTPKSGVGSDAVTQQHSPEAKTRGRKRNPNQPRQRKSSAVCGKKKTPRTWVEKRASELRRQRERDALREQQVVDECLSSGEDHQASQNADSQLTPVSPGKLPHAPSIAAGAPQSQSAASARSNGVAASSPVVDQSHATHGGVISLNSPAAMQQTAGNATPKSLASATKNTRVNRRSAADFPIKQISLAIGGLGIAAALFIVVPSLLRFEGGLPTEADVQNQLQTFVDQYETAAGSAASWNSFVAEVRTTAGDFIKLYRQAPGDRTERDIELQEAATALIQMVNSGEDKTAKHQKLLNIAIGKLQGDQSV